MFVWSIYAILVFLLAVIVVSAATTIVYRLVNAQGLSWTEVFHLAPAPAPAPSTMYSCQSTGTCQLDVDGSFNSLEQCADYCDHAQCIVLEDGAQCSHTPGIFDNQTVEDCNATCGKGSALSYVCSTSQGCRPASTFETGVYADSTCNNECQAYDLSSNGMCELMTISGGVKYDGLTSCENAKYTWSCTDYTVDNETGGPVCTMDASVIDGNAVDSTLCHGICNPTSYPTCNSDAASKMSDTSKMGDSILSVYCEGSDEDASCTIKYTGTFNTDLPGRCTRCARTTDGVSPLYCELDAAAALSALK